MSLQIGAALRDAGHQLVSRTGAILFAVYLLVMVGIQSGVNSLLAALYVRMGLQEAVEFLPLVVDVPLSVAAVLVLVAMLVGSYLSLVATRTFVAGARESFPAGAFTRNVPLAMANLVVGSLVYSLLVFVGSLLFVVPGVLAYVAFIFLVPYVAVEDRNFVDALRSSYHLGRGNWIPLFALLLVLVAGLGLVGGVVGLVASLLLPRVLSQLALTVVQVPTSLLSLAVVAAAFRQLRDEEGDGGPPTVSDETQTPSTTL